MAYNQTVVTLQLPGKHSPKYFYVTFIQFHQDALNQLLKSQSILKF